MIWYVGQHVSTWDAPYAGVDWIISAVTPTHITIGAPSLQTFEDYTLSMVEFESYHFRDMYVSFPVSGPGDMPKPSVTHKWNVGQKLQYGDSPVGYTITFADPTFYRMLISGTFEEVQYPVYEVDDDPSWQLYSYIAPVPPAPVPPAPPVSPVPPATPSGAAGGGAGGTALFVLCALMAFSRKISRSRKSL